MSNSAAHSDLDQYSKVKIMGTHQGITIQTLPKIPKAYNDLESILRSYNIFHFRILIKMISSFLSRM